MQDIVSLFTGLPGGRPVTAWHFHDRAGYRHHDMGFVDIFVRCGRGKNGLMHAIDGAMLIIDDPGLPTIFDLERRLAIGLFRFLTMADDRISCRSHAGQATRATHGFERDANACMGREAGAAGCSMR
ncbi:hypothetical protein AAC691_05865 [Nguyenibacter vanlangensis]|uniref:Uncharacterized protein n=1 Tax=Nguyenibacter vanlangensis TaxID=1216886 RepID=A0ABZ3D844_9PROT